ncbi:MAG: hypothetical protein IT384_33515 [Deltaproteobacteria bacterium]|nr:hypothetical protein [Deltaproteobacteria bacterium]
MSCEPRSQRAWLLALLLLLTGTRCSDGASGHGDGADSTVIVGDARPRDATAPSDAADAGGARDADPADTDAAGPGGEDAADGDALGGDTGVACDPPSDATLTASSALSALGTWDGHVVDVVGTATATAQTCTDIACTPANPCCNRCTAELRIDHLLPLAPGPCAASVGCTGDECGLVCTPPVFGVQTFRGVLRSSPARLELVRVRP